ncbi:glycosyltransferase family 2 protein [Roseinatronobacter sp.]|uniref:glycosyltransferase family 2 protein n=1 Tax=Roseinatronobacter sp. TaxID=1945755 RepID=UPI0025FA311B|nr:glycosyltransferase family 2 protein [Rhodobaca sp.]
MTTLSEPTRERVLIVIPTLNEADHIQGVIQTLLHDAPPHTLLVVADGGSTDGTPSLVRQMDDPRIRFLENPHRIQSAAINLAVAALGEGVTHLLRADAHAIYPRGFLRALLADMHATDATAVTVAMTTLADQGFSAGVAAAQNSRLGTGGAAHRLGKGGRFVDHGHHALIRMDAFRAIGGYDARQSHNEDAEFDHRLTRNGGRIWLSGRTQMGYFPRQTAKALFLQYFRFGAGRAQTLLKHDLMPRPRQLLPLLVAPAVAMAVLGLAGLLLVPSWGWLVLIAPAVLWAALCLGYGALLALQARRASVLWAGPAAMLMHLGWSAGFLRQIASHRSGERVWSTVRNQ